MSLNFDNLMKKFYDDPMLGLQQEDAPANSVAGGGVSLPPDAVMDKKKKKEKKPYDGRTKEARRFYKRMTELKAKREMKKQSKLAAKVQENTINREHEYLLAEDNVDVLKNIVKNKQKWPVSDKLYEETGIRTFGDIHKKYDIFEEHIIPVDLRLRTGIFKIKQNYSKEELYEWFYDTLNLVYKLQSEHDESTNGGKLAETLLPEELHQKDKWEKLN